MGTNLKEVEAAISKLEELKGSDFLHQTLEDSQRNIIISCIEPALSALTAVYDFMLENLTLELLLKEE